ncbi:MAG: hypothetical protein FJ104_00960 [Deltaproteobacteria bacterium]|nr:hypothetical protein [Deltaproteobacteria bacterium]
MRGQWTIVALASLSAAALWFTRPTEPRAGEHVTAELTTTAEALRSGACALDAQPSGLSCAFGRTGDAPRADVVPADLLVPLETAHRSRYLVAGLGELPSVRSRAARGAQAKLTGTCDLELVARVAGATTRASPGRPWEPVPGELWVARARSCSFR